MKEAAARIKINKLLEAAGWRFFPEGNAPANVRLEAAVTLQSGELDALGENFEHAGKGFVDFLLLDNKGFPLVVLEAKSEEKHPLIGKEQARKYARSQNCRFVILSNGNQHYLWDLDSGNPEPLAAFPGPDDFVERKKFEPDRKRILSEPVAADYIVTTQRPNYAADAGWRNEAERPGYIQANRLRFLRRYQLDAIHAVQRAIKEGKDRFLFEMATGTGKTLTAAAAIKLFQRTGNARRALFLVDRLELEDQALKNLKQWLSADFQSVIYKENRDDWRKAEIVVTTVQSLLFNNKYQRLFSPTDFDLVISDEAHRSIGGNARAVFDYFIGWKLGLTATPRDYLKRFNPDAPTSNDPREIERRLLLDTYRAFGCESGEPTFRYTLLDGVRDGYLVNPTVVDARTDVTTELLSVQGKIVAIPSGNSGNGDGGEGGEGSDGQAAFTHRDFEKSFFSDETNALFCRTFLEHALRDPISGEIGKAIVFAVSQRHAAKLTQILNQIADRMFPGVYQSDFAVQVTSDVADAQQFTIKFSNNNLMGSGAMLPEYRTSKARVCVTVGMMTTGYDCTDILNLGLFRPIFSPTDFVQIKGRGTRTHDFRDQLIDETLKAEIARPLKTTFKLFDFFANCEYFEERFNYDEVLKLPKPVSKEPRPDDPPGPIYEHFSYDHLGGDALKSVQEAAIGAEGMKIDRMLFARFEETIRSDETIAAAVEAGQWERVIDYVNREIFDRPEEYYTLEKLRKAAAVDRRVTLREMLEKIFGLIPRFKTKDELLEEEFAKFVADVQPEQAAAIPAIKTYFKAYATSDKIRDIIDHKRFAELATNPIFSSRDFRDVPKEYRERVPEYIKDYVSLNQFAA